MYIGLGVFITFGIIEFSGVVYLFISLSAALYAASHILYKIKEEIHPQIKDGTLKETWVYKSIIFVGEHMTGHTLSVALFITILTKYIFPEYMTQISNGSTLMSLAAVFFSIGIFERN